MQLSSLQNTVFDFKMCNHFTSNIHTLQEVKLHGDVLALYI